MRNNIFESVVFLNETTSNYVLNEGVISGIRRKLDEIYTNIESDNNGGMKKLKSFIDKNYDKLINICNILEKEPKKVKTSYIPMIGSFAVTLLGMLIGGWSSFLAAGVAITILGLIGMIVSLFINLVKESNNAECINWLIKIRETIYRTNPNVLNDEDFRKGQSILDSINSVLRANGYDI